MLAPTPRVAVIGGGVSGAAVALHLLRDAPDLPVQIEIVEPRAAPGAGLAYGSQDAQHRINVSAARMAMFAEDPTHLDRWCRAQGLPESDPACVAEGVGLFPRRGDFGRYLAETLRDAAAAAPLARLVHVRARAERVEPAPGGWRTALDSGATGVADVVVLATGHPPAEPPAALDGLRGDPGLLADPWRPLDVAPDARVLIVGTGLTMLDVLASLRAGGHRGPVVALSRRGLLPRPRTRLPVAPRGTFDDPPSRVASALLRRVRAEIAAGQARGQPWEDVIDALRVQGRAVWSALPPPERRRLLRHVQPFWDVHRYQCSPQIEAVLRANLADGRLRVLAARLLGAGRVAGGIEVRLRPRGKAAETLACDTVICCTGPAHRRAIAANPALDSLHRAGLVTPDGYGLGLAVDDQGRALGVDGRPTPSLFVAGPPARGTWGELMGLPQVSAQPRDIAAQVASLLRQSAMFHAQEAHA